MTFATGLRSILRQDPDVIMVGEIRDEETAEICMQTAQTGHLVLSTIHTNTAVATVTRLKDLGVPPVVIASSLGAVIAQRLVRVLCPHCRACKGCRSSTLPNPWDLIPTLSNRPKAARSALILDTKDARRSSAFVKATRRCSSQGNS